jgi:AhpD family alkylhydroperoxidase
MTVTPLEHSAAGPSSTHPRIDIDSTAPGAEDALGALDRYIATQTAKLGLEPALSELVRVRASQINGCHLCLDMHTRDARARGVTERRLDVLPAWREAPWYTDRERAALAWTEAVTLVADGRVPDGVYEEMRHEFDEQEIAALTLVVIAVNGWNRLAISLRMVPSDS